MVGAVGGVAIGAIGGNAALGMTVGRVAGMGAGYIYRKSKEGSERALTLLLMLFSISGCARFGPTSVDRDRFDCIRAIATSWKQQTLIDP